MKINQEALELTKKFAQGAPCAINFDYIEETMFWSIYLEIAKNKKLLEVNMDVVREYWLERHNQIVVNRFRKGHFNFEKAIDCMVRAIKTENQELTCIHGGVKVCPLSEYEYEELMRRNAKLITDLSQGVR